MRPGNVPFSSGKVSGKAESLGISLLGVEGVICILKDVTLCLCPLEGPIPSSSWLGLNLSRPFPAQKSHSQESWCCSHLVFSRILWLISPTEPGMDTEAPSPCQLIPCLSCILQETLRFGKKKPHIDVGMSQIHLHPRFHLTSQQNHGVKRFGLE